MALFTMKYKKQIFFTLLLIFGIMFPMSQFTWGDLPKDQTDAQLISEAITQAIADHNDDPTAHMDSGQSIDIHRLNTTIDHPAMSIVSDKFSRNEMTFFETFSNIANWDITAGVQQLPLGFRITQTVASQSASRSAYNDNYTDFIDDTGNSAIDLQIAFSYSYTGNKTKFYGGTDFLTDSNSIGFGFTVENGNLKVYTNLNNNSTASSNIAISQNKLHVIRFTYLPADRIMHVFLDGSLVQSETWPTTTHGTVDIGSTNFELARTATLSGSDSAIFVVRSMLFSTSYIN